MRVALMPNKALQILFIVLTAFTFSICNGQNINIKDGLIFQSPYDGDVTGKEPKSINLFPSAPKIISYRYNVGNQIINDQSSNVVANLST